MIQEQLSVYQRKVEALSYEAEEKSILTSKQYLVYAYLLSVSKWNAERKEDHYYVYKNSFTIKDAIALIGISAPTWRSTIKKLCDLGYIKESADKKSYLISLPQYYAPLELNLIKFLLSFGAALKNGENIVSVYSVIYFYWRHCQNQNRDCEITINQLKNLFKTRSNKEDYLPYKIMMNLFEYYGLIQIKRIGREFNNNPYTAYQILCVNLKAPQNVDLDVHAPGDIKDILEALANE